MTWSEKVKIYCLVRIPLFQVLETTQLVPVVFGGVDHFGRILPEHSFIDALSQKNPASLARYLGHLGEKTIVFFVRVIWDRSI